VASWFLMFIRIHLLVPHYCVLIQMLSSMISGEIEHLCHPIDLKFYQR